MKKAAVAIGVVLLMLFAFIAGVAKNEIDQNECVSEPAITKTTAVSLSSDGLTVKGIPITKPQQQNAEEIARAGFDAGATPRDIQIAFATAFQESTLLNLPYGYPGSTSLGLFQQIADWAPAHVRMNPYKSATLFFTGGRQGQDGLLDIENRENLTVAQAAQAVQGSDYPDAYAEHEDEAKALVDALTGGEGQVESGSDCEEVDPVEEAVQAAISKVGSAYKWDDKTGLSLVCSAFEQANIALPCDPELLKDYTGDPETGIVASEVPLDQIHSPEDLEPGDILGWAPDADGVATRWSVNAGTDALFGETDINIGTYNVLGSNHTGHDSAMNRIGDVARNITSDHVDIVGMQEFQQDQRVELMKLLPDYDVYPKLDYGDRYVTVNSIIYNTTKYELVEGSLTPMPKYYNNRKTDIPLIKFRNLDTGQEFYVANTHDPSQVQYQYLRYLAAQEHAKLNDSLFLEGLPVYFTGDFNSGFGVRFHRGNRTYQNKRANLTWCIMTKSGVMRNAYDALKGRHGCPRQTTREKGIGVVDHVYVSRGVAVDQYVVEWENTGSDHPFVYVQTKVGNGTNTVEPKSDDYTLAIGKTGSKVGVNQVKVPDDLVSVIRLTVTEPSTAPSSTDGEWVFPLAEGTYHYESNSYGPRELNGDDFHNGTDFGTSGAKPDLFAMHSGTVVRMEWSDAWGNYYVIETGVPVPGESGNTYKYLYAHLSSYQPFIAVGTEVGVGQKLGQVGDTGFSFGEHLHLTICTTMECTYGNQEGSVDPVPFLNALGIHF